jgi:hypothetical protein
MRNYLVEQEKPKEIELAPNGMSLDLLRAVYRNSSIPLSTRIRCAVAALPHEFPRLQVTAQVTENDFASLLDARIANMERVNNSNGRIIEAPPVETKPPMPRVADRRYRRI